MTRIEFLLLPPAYPLAAQLKLILPHARSPARPGGVYVHAADESQLAGLDRGLTSELGHLHPVQRLMASDIDNAHVNQCDSAHVMIGNCGRPDGSHRTLFNLSEQIPAFFARFEQFYEFVCGDETARKMGRERYRYYKRLGYPLTHRTIEPPA